MSSPDLYAKEMENSVLQDMPDTKLQNKGRWQFFGLLVFFSCPILLVLLMVKFDWHPAIQTHGHLLRPPITIQLPDILFDTFQSNNQAPLHAEARPTCPSCDFWHNKWSMVIVADTCIASCQTQLANIRQLHASLAKDIERMQRVLILGSDDVTDLRKQYPDLRIVQLVEPASMELRQQFYATTPKMSQGNIYLVDPQGQLVMVFPEDLSPRLIRKDITRLLRYAWSG